MGLDRASLGTHPLRGRPAYRHRGSALFLSCAVSAPTASLILEPSPRPPTRSPKLHLPLQISPVMKPMTGLLHPISLSLPPASLQRKTEVLAFLNGHPPTASQVERGSNSVGVHQGACVRQGRSRAAPGTSPTCHRATRSSRRGVSWTRRHGECPAEPRPHLRCGRAQSPRSSKGPSQGWAWSSEHVSWQWPAATGKMS